MTTVSFTPSGPSLRIEYTDDSTEVSALNGGAVNWLVMNPDNTHAVCVNFGFTDGDVEAIMPLNGTPGGTRDFMPKAGQNYKGNADKINCGRGPTKGNQC